MKKIALKKKIFLKWTNHGMQDCRILNEKKSVKYFSEHETNKKIGDAKVVGSEK